MRPYIILILLVIVAYANSLSNSFAWDEIDLIVNNPKIDLSFKEMPSVFTTPLWKTAGLVKTGYVYYRPVVSLLFILNYKLWGLNPTCFHLTNILLHLISVIVLYRVGLLLFNNDTFISLIGASIFAVHPVNNEPVGRAASGEIIFGFFIIFTIYLFLREKKYLSFSTFFFALLSKETAVMLPFALAVLSTHKNLSSYALKRQGFKPVPASSKQGRGIIEITPYIVLTVIYLTIRAMAVDTIFGNKAPQPIHAQIFTMAAAALDYIRLLIIPYPLSPFYPAIWYASIFEPKVIFAILILGLISFLALRTRKDKTMFFLLTFPFIMLAPAIWMVNAFTAGGDFVYIAERFLYVPSMLFPIFAIYLLKDRAGRHVKTGGILIVIMFTIITISANTVWKNNLALFQKIEKDSPNTAFAHNGLGVIYYNKGLLNEAVQEYLTALRLNPDDREIHYNLRLAYALKEYRASKKLKFDYPEIHYYIGQAYYDNRRFDEARKEFETALKLKPDFTTAKEAIEKLDR